MQSDVELVLVVEDSPELTSFLVNTLLPHYGYRSVSATTGAQALHIINQQHPDVVLMDIELPDVNGLDLVERLRQQGIKTPVIVTTAFGSEETAVRAFRLGVRDYLIKPYTADQVAAAIEDALYLSRLEEEKERLTQQLQRRVQELTVLERIGRSVAAVLDLDTLLNRVVEASVFITQADEGFLLLLDPETNEPYLRAAKNLEEDQVRLLHLKVKDNLLRQVLRTGLPLSLGNVEDASSNLKVATGYSVQSLLYVPLVAQDKVVGVLSVDNRTTPRTFSQNDVERLSALANYAVIALQNAWLHESLKAHAAQVEATYVELKELSQIKTQFVQDISHELRVPLTFIKGYVDLLREGAFGEVGLEQLEPLDIIAERTERITQLVSDMLTLQRLESEGIGLAQVNLTEIAHAAIDGARAAAQRAGLVIEEKGPDTLPTIVGDPDQLPRVFDNLLSNAIKFSPDGGLVTVRIHEEQNQVNVYISDTGIGISPENLEHLFSRFYRANESEGKHIAGTGLGLSIVKAIVEAHGGHVSVQSQEGQGSTFSFSLPKAGPEAGLASPPAPLDSLGQYFPLAYGT
ncbi:MAG: ATP-binding protein [Anaerolineae bacterium]|jgi:two-component system NtrC family sensor kinase